MLAGVAKLSSLKGTSLKSSAPERGSACVVRIAMLFGDLAKLRALPASRSPKNTSASEGSRCALHAVIVFSSICGSCSSRELKIELKLRRRGEARPPFRSGALITSATAFRMRSTPRLTEKKIYSTYTELVWRESLGRHDVFHQQVHHLCCRSVRPPAAPTAIPVHAPLVANFLDFSYSRSELFSIRRVWMISPPPRTRSFQSHSLCLYSDGRKL